MIIIRGGSMFEGLTLKDFIGIAITGILGLIWAGLMICVLG